MKKLNLKKKPNNSGKRFVRTSVNADIRRHVETVNNVFIELTNESKRINLLVVNLLKNKINVN